MHEGAQILLILAILVAAFGAMLICAYLTGSWLFATGVGLATAGFFGIAVVLIIYFRGDPA